MKHERSSNFELLRLLCIFGILVMHTFAGIDTAASPGNMLANVFANSLFNTGVTCFILLSGYFGIRFDLKKLIGLDLMVIFFTVVGTVALGDFGVKDLIKSCIPVLSRRYWFITCYFVLCILAPFLNQMAERLEREHFRRLLLLLLLVFSLIPTVTTYDVMQDAGKGLAHFVMIYLLGRYLARYHTGHCSKKQLLLGITGSTALIFCADGALTLHQGVIYSTFSRDCSIFIIFTAVLLLLLFREFSLQSRIINRAATNVLAIYVLDQVIRSLQRRCAAEVDFVLPRAFLMMGAFGPDAHLLERQADFAADIFPLVLGGDVAGRHHRRLSAGLRCAPYSYGSADCSLVYFDGLIRTTNYFCFNMRFL